MRIFLLFFSGMLLFSCNGGDHTQQGIPPHIFFENKTYALKYPRTWKPEEVEKGRMDFLVYCANEGEKDDFDDYVGVSAYSDSTFTTMEDFSSRKLEALKSDTTGIQLISSGIGKNNVGDYFDFTYEVSTDEIKVVIQKRIYKHHEALYELAFIALPATREKNKQGAMMIFDSFRFQF